MKTKLSIFFLISVSVVSLFAQTPKAQTDSVSKPSSVDKTETPVSAPVKPATTTSSRSATVSSSPSEGSTLTTQEIWINSATSFELKSTDDESKVDYIEYKINQGEYVRYSTPITITEEGSYNITYRAVDRAGNVETPKTLIVRVDNTPPTVTLISAEPLYTVDGNVYASKNNTYQIKSDDKASGVQQTTYAVNNDSPKAIKPEDTFKLEKSGPNVVKYSSLDGSGNKTPDSSTVIYIDDIKPTIEIIPDRAFVNIDGKNYANKATKYALRATDKESGVRRIFYKTKNTNGFVTYIDPIQFDQTGEYTIEARSVDNVGNESDLATLTVLVDIIPPTTIIRKLGNGSN